MAGEVLSRVYIGSTNSGGGNTSRSSRARASLRVTRAFAAAGLSSEQLLYLVPLMLRRLILAVCILLLPLAAVRSQTVPAASGNDSADVPKRFLPGLEWFMNLIQVEHAKLWYAGEARNWPLAGYQLAEIKEIMGDVQDLVPVYRSLPFADMMDAVVTGPIVDLEKAIEAKDARAFTTAYDKLSAACNACHLAVDHEFIIIRRPQSGGFPNQDFRPHP
jgi:hypothetical protein